MRASLSLANAGDNRDRDDSDLATRDIGGIEIAVKERETAIADVLDAVETGRHLKLAFCNANLVNVAAGDAALRDRLSDFLMLPDGIGVDIGSRLLYGAPFPSNLNGTDFFPDLFARAERPLHVALLGGKPGVPDRAAARLAQSYPAHRFSVVSHGYYEPSEEKRLIEGLKAERPDLLLVAMGNPLQERFIADRLASQHVTVAAGVGALFDFLAGEVSRAPKAIRKARLEWAYRLWLEPARLWRRYVVGNPVFLMRMVSQYVRAGGRG
ncbi:WecB/TagA/CpsF family glycosyltransferase [Bosea thiooxidans]